MQIAHGAIGIYGGEGEIAHLCKRVGQAVQGGGFARRRFADESNQRISGHGGVGGGEIMRMQWIMYGYLSGTGYRATGSRCMGRSGRRERVGE